MSKERLRLFDPVFSEIDRLLLERESSIVAIDGRCASGKSTLAGLIHSAYGCNVFRMDDFFLTPDMRTPRRLAQPGGNVDYERFKEQVLDRLREGREFTYQAYDCSTGGFSDSAPVTPGRLSVVEGSYSLHPYFGGAYDLAVFLTVRHQVQLERILSRNGPEMAKRFKEEWIPLEEAYFACFGIEGKSGVVIET